jgi:hypothetical protein
MVRQKQKENYQEDYQEDVQEEESYSDASLNNKILQNKNLELQSALSSASFQNFGEDENLIKSQLETEKILERSEHYLKGDIIRFNEDGAYYSEPKKNVLCIIKIDEKTGIKYYIQEIKESKKGTELIREIVVKVISQEGEEIDINESDSRIVIERIKKIEKLKESGYEYIEIIDEDRKPLNDYGVSEIMRILSMYVTKETFLSYYDVDRINEIMNDLGKEMSQFFYCNYEKMGMDTKYKESKFKLMVINILHLIESCYRRALNGNEQEGLRTRAIVTQTGSAGNNNDYNGMRGKSILKKKWSPFKLDTW